MMMSDDHGLKWILLDINQKNKIGPLYEKGLLRLKLDGGKKALRKPRTSIAQPREWLREIRDKLIPFSRNFLHTLRLQNILGLIFTLLVLASFLSPWWRITVEDVSVGLPQTIVVFPQGTYGYEDLVNSQKPEYIAGIFIIYKSLNDPSWLRFLMGGVVVCLLSSFLGSIAQGAKGRVLLGVAGLSLLFMMCNFYLKILGFSGDPAISKGYVASTDNCNIFLLKFTSSFELGYSIATWAIALCFVSIAATYLYEKFRCQKA